MIDIYTDGSCIGNPGPGGWAAIIVENGGTRKVHGRDENTTNNRMEILAAIQGIEATPSGVDVRVHSDSSYLINTMTKGWKRNKNKDLWARLDFEVAKRNVQWSWVKGHAGHPLNEKADRIANAEARGEPVNDLSRPSQAPNSRHSRESGNPSPVLPPNKTGEQVPPPKLSHVDASGKAQMVDVGPKAATERVAVVTGTVLMQPETLKLIEANDIEKGDTLGVARIAGVMAAKNTAQLIPLCHPAAPRPGDGRVPPRPRALLGRHPCHRPDDRQDRRRDGGDDRRQRRRADDLRHVQGRRPRNANRRYPTPPQDRRQKRRHRP